MMVVIARISSSYVVAMLTLLLHMVPLLEAGVLFSSLERTLVVSVMANNSTPFEVARAGEDDLHVSWSLNMSFASGFDASYKSVKLELCFAPVSQVNRNWRKTDNDLQKDKTCQFDIALQPYKAVGNYTVWKIPKTIPKATYFVRAYAVNSAGTQLAYGQTTDKNKTTNLFVVEAITGRNASLDIAAGCFSAFSVLALFFFFFGEKKFHHSA